MALSECGISNMSNCIRLYNITTCRTDGQNLYNNVAICMLICMKTRDKNERRQRVKTNSASIHVTTAWAPALCISAVEVIRQFSL